MRKADMIVVFIMQSGKIIYWKKIYKIRCDKANN